jgi:hypothetical protein
MDLVLLAQDGQILPDALRFLNWGWWIVHVIAIVVVLLIGMAIGKKKAAKPAQQS